MALIYVFKVIFSTPICTIFCAKFKFNYFLLQTISQDVNNTGPETLPVSVCNCFLYFTCKENNLMMLV